MYCLLSCFSVTNTTFLYVIDPKKAVPMQVQKGSTKYIPALNLMCTAVVCANFNKFKRKIKKLSKEDRDALFTMIKLRQVQPNFRRYRPTTNGKSNDLVPPISSLVKYFLSSKTKDVELPGFALSEEDCAALVKQCKSMRVLSIGFCPSLPSASLQV